MIFHDSRPRKLIYLLWRHWLAIITSVVSRQATTTLSPALKPFYGTPLGSALAKASKITNHWNGSSILLWSLVITQSRSRRSPRAIGVPHRAFLLFTLCTGKGGKKSYWLIHECKRYLWVQGHGWSLLIISISQSLQLNSECRTINYYLIFAIRHYWFVYVLKSFE